MSVAAGPFNLFSGQQTQLIPPGNLGIYKAVAVYNNSGANLVLDNNASQDFLPSNMGQLYALSRTGSPFSVTPQNLQPIAGYAVGTVSGTFYLSEDVLPSGFPVSLSPYPGGAALMWSGESVVLTTPPPFLQRTVVNVQLPNNGRVYVSVYFFSTHAINPGAANSGRATITGLQSGAVYFDNISTNVPQNPIIVKIVSPDTAVQVIVDLENDVSAQNNGTISAAPYT